MSLSAPAGLAQKGSAPADHSMVMEEPDFDHIDVEDLFDEVFGAAPVASDSELSSRLWQHAETQTERLSDARAALTAAEQAHDAAQAALAAVRAVSRPLDASKSQRRSEFCSAYRGLRRLVGQHPSQAEGLFDSRDWIGVQDKAEALIAAAMGLAIAREAEPASPGDRSGARTAVWVSAEAIYQPPEEAAQHGANGEVAMLAWVEMWVHDDGESFEIAAGVVEVAAGGELQWSEPLRWTDPGLKWMAERGIDTEPLTVSGHWREDLEIARAQEAEGAAGLEM